VQQADQNGDSRAEKGRIRGAFVNFWNLIDNERIRCRVAPMATGTGIGTHQKEKKFWACLGGRLLTGETEREVLARHLSNLALGDAIREIGNVDCDANMVMWRNPTGDEFHTVFLLPNAELTITLVEKNIGVSSAHGTGAKARSSDIRYIDVRITDLERVVFKYSSD
jgi:hypothetical protein